MDTIYQITDHPIDEDDFINACDFEDSWFVPAVAEYVRECDDRPPAISAFMNMLESNQLAITDHETSSFVLLPNARNIYFEGRYQQFQTYLTELSHVQEDKFISCQNQVEGLLYELSRCFSERFGSYVAGDGDELISLDEFIRVTNAGTTYYMGGIVYYHM